MSVWTIPWEGTLPQLGDEVSFERAPIGRVVVAKHGIVMVDVPGFSFEPEAVTYDEDAEACEYCNASDAAEAPLLDRIENALESEILDVEDAIALLEEASDTLRAIQNAMG